MVAGVGSMEVNVFQRGCDVVIQKSIREGFGLVVAEALWKENQSLPEEPVEYPCSSGRIRSLSHN
jgi:hypothetical protein